MTGYRLRNPYNAVYHGVSEEPYSQINTQKKEVGTFLDSAHSCLLMREATSATDPASGWQTHNDGCSALGHVQDKSNYLCGKPGSLLISDDCLPDMLAPRAAPSPAPRTDTLYD